MGLLRHFSIQIRAFFLSLIRRSFKTHGSVRVSDLAISLDFYRKLGFRQVMSTQGGEVLLLRNHRGDEINIARQISASTGQVTSSSIAIQAGNLERELPHLQTVQVNLAIVEDSFTRRVQLTDPDGNEIEFYERIDSSDLSRVRVYHIATESELTAGLTPDYYLPPDEDNRFVRARARSAFLALSCKRVAEEAMATPLVVEMDEGKLSIESQLFDDLEIDSGKPDTRSVYPRVNSPIPRDAIASVGLCEKKGGDFLWPSRFSTLESLSVPAE